MLYSILDITSHFSQYLCNGILDSVCNGCSSLYYVKLDSSYKTPVGPDCVF